MNSFIVNAFKTPSGEIVSVKNDGYNEGERQDYSDAKMSLPVVANISVLYVGLKVFTITALFPQTTQPTSSQTSCSIPASVRVSPISPTATGHWTATTTALGADVLTSSPSWRTNGAFT